MNRHTPTAQSFGYIKVILPALLVAQAVATFQVRQSNLALYAKLKAVSDNGYLAVPNGLALDSLRSFSSALYGGLFFTLSIGAILTLVTMAVSRLYLHPANKSRLHHLAPAILWGILLILINLSGFDLHVNLYFWLIPPVVYLLISRFQNEAFDLRSVTVQVVPVIILAALWFTQYDQYLFIDIRDRLLLSNPVGAQVNKFYYRYTLYPAESFKAPSQKTINTYLIDSTIDSNQHRSLTKSLIRSDWLPVTSVKTADLVLRKDKGQLELMHEGRVVTQSQVRDLAERPAEVLDQFSSGVDRYSLFRLISFYGLLLGFPILLYIGLFTLIRLLGTLFIDSQKSLMAASAICLLLGVMIWGYFQYGRVDTTPAYDNASFLSSKNWRAQVVALRQYPILGRDVMRTPEYAGLKKSDRVPLRYWLVEALAASRQDEAFTEIVEFLDDSSLNVRTRACQVLGQRRDPRAIPELVRRLSRSDEWYFQWYAYKAMKALGWNQDPSN